MNVTHEDTMRQAQILAMSQMSDALRSLSNRFDKQQDKQDTVVELIGAVRTDIAVMKAQQEELDELRESCRDHAKRLDMLELRNAQQDGAASFINWVKEFGPWLFGLAVLFFSLFGKTGTPPHP